MTPSGLNIARIGAHKRSAFRKSKKYLDQAAMLAMNEFQTDSTIQKHISGQLLASMKKKVKAEAESILDELQPIDGESDITCTAKATFVPEPCATAGTVAFTFGYKGVSSPSLLQRT